MFKKKPKQEIIVINKSLEEDFYKLRIDVFELLEKQKQIENKVQLINGKGKVFKVHYPFGSYPNARIPSINGVLFKKDFEVTQELEFDLFQFKYKAKFKKVNYENEDLYELVEIKEIK